MAEKLLAQKLAGYRKNALDFELLKDKVDIAISQEKLFCEDVYKLKYKLGTNVGMLLTGMRNQH